LSDITLLEERVRALEMQMVEHNANLKQIGVYLRAGLIMIGSLVGFSINDLGML